MIQGGVRPFPQCGNRNSWKVPQLSEQSRLLFASLWNYTTNAAVAACRPTRQTLVAAAVIIETMLPLARGTELSISFWIESERVDTTAIVRACDGGVGMGIDFTALDVKSQERLQRYLERLDTESKS